MAYAIPDCDCPESPRTAADFEVMANCPLSSEYESDLARRTAARLAAQAARRDPRSLTFDPKLAADDELRDQHRRAFGSAHTCDFCAAVA